MSGPQQGGQQPWNHDQAGGQPWGNGRPGGQPAWNPGPAPGWSGGPPPPRHGGSVWLGVAVGLVVALVAGAVLVATGALGFGSTDSAAGRDDRPIELPDELAGLSDALTVLRQHPDMFGDDGEQIIAEGPDVIKRMTTAYSKAYGDVPAAVRAYADPDSEVLVAVIAVRADSPEFITEDFQRLGRASNELYTVWEGDVQCYVLDYQAAHPDSDGDSSEAPSSTDAPPTSMDDLPASAATYNCQRTSPRLTVAVRGGSTGSEGARRMVALTNAAFHAAS